MKNCSTFTFGDEMWTACNVHILRHITGKNKANVFFEKKKTTKQQNVLLF